LLRHGALWGHWNQRRRLKWEKSLSKGNVRSELVLRDHEADIRIVSLMDLIICGCLGSNLVGILSKLFNLNFSLINFKVYFLRLRLSGKVG
jgi:hypothetical protein